MPPLVPSSAQPSEPPAVLLTRPVRDSAALAANLRRAGAAVVVSPLLRIRPTEALPPGAEALILTSPNGAAAYRALGGPAGLPVWCVGPRTASLARAAGLHVQAVATTASDLAAIIPDDAPPLQHLRGAVQRGDLVAALRARGLRAEDAVLYHQDPGELSHEALAMLSAGPTIVPLYSPRTASIFAAQCPGPVWPNVAAVALSAAIADMLPIRAYVAKQPEGTSMLGAIMELLGGSAVEGGAGSH